MSLAAAAELGLEVQEIEEIDRAVLVEVGAAGAVSEAGHPALVLALRVDSIAADHRAVMADVERRLQGPAADIEAVIEHEHVAHAAHALLSRPDEGFPPVDGAAAEARVIGIAHDD